MSTELTQPLVSVVVPARNEFPQIVFTIQSILNDLESFLKPSEYEIILCANACDDWHKCDPHKRAVLGTVEYMATMGGYSRRTIRYLIDPIAANHTTRNRGVEMARGKYIFLSDAHMSYKPGYFKRMIQTIDETGGLVHSAIGWLGAFPVNKTNGMSYTIKLGEEIKGTWNNYAVSQNDWFYIPAQGHCCLGFKRDQFLDFKGYPEYHRCYGGGEFYLDMKWWLFGSKVVVEPRAIGYHLRSIRGYSYNYDDYIHNVLAIGIALGMDDWAERTFINWHKKGNPEVMKRLWEEAKKETVSDRRFIESRRNKTFNELIVERPWEKLNQEKFGRHNNTVMVFHPTWKNGIAGTPAEKLYNESETQKGLEKFIYENLSDCIYKPGFQPTKLQSLIHEAQGNVPQTDLQLV